MFGFPYPECENCGAVYANREAHQRFHDSIGAIYQKAFGMTDEEYERVTGQPAAERDDRILAAVRNRPQPPHPC